MIPRTTCTDCKAHPDGECDAHFESFGVSVDAGDGDDEVIYPVGLPVTVDGVERLS